MLDTTESRQVAIPVVAQLSLNIIALPDRDKGYVEICSSTDCDNCKEITCIDTSC